MNDDDIICTCYEVSVKDIKDAYANGAKTVEAIGEATQAGTLCGACIGEIESLLESLNK
ncbi:(2Fe-2S)-binding protein [Lachnoclostridium phytofermentans]|uniref:BFD domain protein (2Fe-2S)-binding domain protein n=1 Tax=Lachnoclostridium phytofermentans (strain ATCC 700394 / DSM 18823 / ISDg) TaxID=357809 RepID=A9KLQ7_LACP7|nr:(2Fe-2S)-binding protein [Lachnoclostridium phytofermentans]ABX42801.1 BFD domain protein (2Fe-2S)-binding domain protein [Lachnoclostridium phytofermentans ISDg]